MKLVRKASLALVLAVSACAPAPVESADDVRARENQRVEAAHRKAAEREAKAREEADEQRRARAAEQRTADEAAQKRKEDAMRASTQKEAAWCAGDREERRRHIVSAMETAKKNRARATELEAYMQANCKKSVVDDTEPRQVTDEQGYVRQKQVVVGHHHEWACPPDAPPELRTGGSGLPPASVVIGATADEREKNDRCQDVQDLVRQAAAMSK